MSPPPRAAARAPLPAPVSQRPWVLDGARLALGLALGFAALAAGLFGALALRLRRYDTGAEAAADGTGRADALLAAVLGDLLDPDAVREDPEEPPAPRR